MAPLLEGEIEFGALRGVDGGVVAGGAEGRLVVAVAAGVAQLALVVLLPRLVEVYHFCLVAFQLRQQELSDLCVLHERVAACCRAEALGCGREKGLCGGALGMQLQHAQVAQRERVELQG